MVREIPWESLPRKIFFQEIWASWMRAVPACYGLFRVVPFLQAKMSQNVLTCKFTINQLLQGSASVIIKWDNGLELQSRTTVLNYKVGQVVLQSRAGTGQLLLQSGTAFITKWGKKIQTEQKANERNGGNRFWQPSSSFSPNYVATETLPLGILEKCVIIKRNKKSHPHHRHIYLTCKLEKQLFRAGSCFENYFP